MILPKMLIGKVNAKLKTKMSNDANVAALAEARFGKYKNANSLILITLGTGVGGGVVALMLKVQMFFFGLVMRMSNNSFNRMKKLELLHLRQLRDYSIK